MAKNGLTNLIVYLIILLIWSNELIDCEEIPNPIQSQHAVKANLTQICTVQRNRHALNTDQDFTHMEDTNNYIELITHNDKFIDRSLLIEKIIEGAKNKLVTVPKGCGKTTNLDMIEFFAQMEINNDGKATRPTETKAYQYFVHGMINLPNGEKAKLSKLPLITTKEHIVLRSIANCIVIQLKLDKIIIDDFNSFFYSFKEAIASTFQRHYHLDKRLQKEDMEKFQKIRDCLEDEEEVMETSIQFLTEMLKFVYKRKILITIDDVDSFFVFHQAPDTEEDTKKINKFFKTFMTASLKENYFYWNALMTAVTPLAEVILKELNLRNFSPHDHGNMKDLSPHFESIESEMSNDKKLR